MKNTTIVCFMLLSIASFFSACSKNKGFEVNSKQLVFTIDSLSIAGPIEKTAAAKYDVDELAAQYDVKIGGLKSFKFKSVAFEIIEGDLRFDDLKFIKVSISANALPLKEIVASVDIPTGTDKQFTVTAISDVDVLQYAEAGDITMVFNTETNKNSTKAAKIKATPTVDAVGLAEGFLKN